MMVNPAVGPACAAVVSGTAWMLMWRCPISSDQTDPGGSVTDSSAAEGRKSSHSGGDYGQCVELASAAGTTGMIGVRDSKQRGTGPILAFSRQEVAALLQIIKAGGLS